MLDVVLKIGTYCLDVVLDSKNNVAASSVKVLYLFLNPPSNFSEQFWINLLQNKLMFSLEPLIKSGSTAIFQNKLFTVHKL